MHPSLPSLTLRPTQSIRSACISLAPTHLDLHSCPSPFPLTQPAITHHHTTSQPSDSTLLPFLPPSSRRCCQSSKGGLRDKPGKPVDYYHTCYCLSGLAAAQHAPGGRVLGPADTNALRPADPAVNVVLDRLAAARQHYAARPLPPREAA